MNKEQCLLICLSEECSEIIKAVSKALRFGLDDKHRKSDHFPLSNKEAIIREIHDLFGVLLKLDGIILSESDLEERQVDEKVKKLDKYLKVSMELGIVGRES